VARGGIGVTAGIGLPGNGNAGNSAGFHHGRPLGRENGPYVYPYSSGAANLCGRTGTINCKPAFTSAL